MENGALHTLEHLFATYARNSADASQVVYVGPMGCRTGFYLLVRDTLAPEDVIQPVSYTHLVNLACAILQSLTPEIVEQLNPSL